MRFRIANDSTAAGHATSVVWHASQATAECLITCTSIFISLVYSGTNCSLCLVFLVRALLASRSGLKQTHSIVNPLVRKAFRMGLCTMVWAILALGTFFLFPQKTVYSVFDVTSGSIYTHVGICYLSSRTSYSHREGVQMIYDGLLSRTRLRSRLAEQTEFEVGPPLEVRFLTYPRAWMLILTMC